MKPNRQKFPITKDWKDIEEWDGYYMVSRKGMIMSLERTQLRTMPDGTKRRMGVRRKLLALKKTAKGYRRVQLTREGRHEYFFVHQLVAMTKANGVTGLGYKPDHSDEYQLIGMKIYSWIMDVVLQDHADELIITNLDIDVIATCKGRAFNG